MIHRPLTLVLGANGKTGRRVAERLQRRGWPVRRGSRSASPRFDWLEPTTWPAALADVDQAYITYQPDLGYPGAVEAIERFSALAVELGVGKLVLLSGRGEPAAQSCEDIVQRAGACWTIVRASWFAQNFSEGHFLDPIRDGVFALPVDPAAEPFIDADDIADVVVAALTGEQHGGQIYEVTGPRLVSFAEAIAAIAEASDRTIQVAQITARAYEQAMLEAGVPATLARFLVELMVATLDGRNAQVADGVEQALGRKPRDFNDFVHEAARAGVWS
jgi:uncharacterized protein YbjT (DUF2867 family)